MHSGVFDFFYFSYLVGDKPVVREELPGLENDACIAMKKNFTKKEVRSKWPIFDYQDRFPLVMGAILMAGLCCYYASKVGLLVGMATRNFYLSYFVFLFFIGSALAYIRWEIRVLDREWNWLRDWFKRLVFQASYCWAAPSLALFLTYMAAHKLLSTEVLTSGLFEVDLPWILVLLLLVNLCYTLTFFVLLHKRSDLKRRSLLKGYRLAIHLLNQERSNGAHLEKEVVSRLEPNGNTIDSVYVIRTQKLTSRHKYGDIACFTYKKPFTYLKTIDGKQEIPANESSLVKVEEATDGFFRKIVREMAVPQHMMLGCNRIKDGKLLLKLKEPLNCEIEISKESAPRLRDWILEAVGEITNEEGANYTGGRGYLEKP